MAKAKSKSKPESMRRLMLLRHAKTERGEAGQRDRDRKLTERGRADAPAIGAYMASHDLAPDLVLVSPAVRSEETWALLAPTLSVAPRVTSDDRIYAASPEQLAGVIREAGESRALLLVGHNPGLQELAVRLIASGDGKSRERLAEKLPTCGLVVIDLAVEEWSRLKGKAGRLERFVSPRVIAAETE